MNEPKRIDFTQDVNWSKDFSQDDIAELIALSKKNNEEVLPPDYVFDPKNPPKKCTYLHPPLPLQIDGQEILVYGSNCGDPLVEDADVYVSLDQSIAAVFPWEQPWANKEGREHIRLPIPDMSVPEDDNEFISCLSYVLDKLEEGKVVHVGCIAGHGRTGTFLSALTQLTMRKQLEADNISAIDYVRDNYCAKAVESFSQILYLNHLFGVALPRREFPRLMEFHEMFEENIGATFKQVVAEVGFDATLDAIEKIELDIEKKYNPPKPVVAGRPGVTRGAFTSKYPPFLPEDGYKGLEMDKDGSVEVVQVYPADNDSHSHNKKNKARKTTKVSSAFGKFKAR
jgi:hypothetical protein